MRRMILVDLGSLVSVSSFVQVSWIGSVDSGSLVWDGSFGLICWRRWPLKSSDAYPWRNEIVRFTHEKTDIIFII